MNESFPYKPGSVVVALDVGSSKIACFIARISNEEGDMEVVGLGGGGGGALPTALVGASAMRGAAPRAARTS